MRTDFALRTLILSVWVVALIAAGTGPRVVPLVLAIVLVWAAPLVRGRLRRSMRPEPA